jgi:CBS domain containing-hemolysin-like protein
VEINRFKGSERIQINNFLGAVCVAVLVLILTNVPQKLNTFSVAQIAIAIPLLITSSLAYSKLCSRPVNELSSWNTFAWITHTVGYIMILNALFLLVYETHYRTTAWIFLLTSAALFIAYGIQDTRLKRKRLKEHIVKTIIHIALLFFGAVLPVILAWL